MFEIENLLNSALLRLLVRKMEIQDLRTATITGKGQISIPRELREHEGFEEGSKVAIVNFGDRIEIRPLRQFSEKLFPALASERALAKNWLSKDEDEAWKDL